VQGLVERAIGGQQLAQQKAGGQQSAQSAEKAKGLDDFKP
jgi:hypothetical protein